MADTERVQGPTGHDCRVRTDGGGEERVDAGHFAPPHLPGVEFAVLVLSHQPHRFLFAPSGLKVVLVQKNKLSSFFWSGMVVEGGGGEEEAGQLPPSFERNGVVVLLHLHYTVREEEQKESWAFSSGRIYCFWNYNRPEW
jgi:hypothetical protein